MMLSIPTTANVWGNGDGSVTVKWENETRAPTILGMDRPAGTPADRRLCDLTARNRGKDREGCRSRPARDVTSPEAVSERDAGNGLAF